MNGAGISTKTRESKNEYHTALHGRFSFFRVLKPFSARFCFSLLFPTFCFPRRHGAVSARSRRIYGASLSHNDKTTCSGIRPAGRDRLFRQHATRTAFPVLLRSCRFCGTFLHLVLLSKEKATHARRDIYFLFYCTTVHIYNNIIYK